ncbi:MAG: hypothetical protein RIG61_01125 [Deltaproteobacteria bacterium]
MKKNYIETRYARLIDESKPSTRGFLRSDDFKAWGKSALKLIDEMCGVTSMYYTTFLRTHHEALVIGTEDARFPTHVSLCISILKSAYQEFVRESD